MSEQNEKFYGAKLFESMEGFEYYVSQLTEYPEEERRDIATAMVWFIENGYMVYPRRRCLNLLNDRKTKDSGGDWFSPRVESFKLKKFVKEFH